MIHRLLEYEVTRRLAAANYLRRQAYHHLFLWMVLKRRKLHIKKRKMSVPALAAGGKGSIMDIGPKELERFTGDRRKEGPVEEMRK
jgi:hypothetical protein